MTKTALFVIYNHRFDRNIPKIETMYKGRFSHIYHVMPFYDGTADNVIPVYESSYFFEGYIAQAYARLKNEGFTHYFMVADDMVINPAINENTLWKLTGLSEDDCYINNFIQMQDRKKPWHRTFEALTYKTNKRGVQIMDILPDVEQARKCFDKYNFTYGKFSLMSLWKALNMSARNYTRLLDVKRQLDYPLIGGYSDILLVTAECMDKFATYCGAFAATELFVEIAIPTALVLSSDKVKTSQDVRLKPCLMWNAQDLKFRDKFNYSYQHLVDNYPEGMFYIHPVKLSKWK